MEWTKFNMIPSLDWMSQLEKLVIINRGVMYFDWMVSEDLMIGCFLRRIFKRSTMENLQRLWIRADNVNPFSAPNSNFNRIQSLLIGSGNSIEVKSPEQLKHIGNIDFSGLTYYPVLQYAHDHCNSREVILINFAWCSFF